MNSQLVSYTDGNVQLLVEATVPAVGYVVYDVRLAGSEKKWLLLKPRTLKIHFIN